MRDISLPDGDGRQFLATLRRCGQDTPVIIKTARSAVADRIDSLDGGAAAAQAGRFGCADRNGAGPGLPVDCGGGA
ncbi:MAG: hypothetical protein WBP18_02410 [Paracoccaceae bacterium]